MFTFSAETIDVPSYSSDFCRQNGGLNLFLQVVFPNYEVPPLSPCIIKTSEERKKRKKNFSG